MSVSKKDISLCLKQTLNKMNKPRNYITALPSYQFPTDHLDDYLPFTDKHVFVRDIRKEFNGYGHWKLTVDLRIDDKTVTLWAVTNNSMLIDMWHNEDGEVNQEIMARAANIVLAANEDKLENII